MTDMLEWVALTTGAAGATAERLGLEDTFGDAVSVSFCSCEGGSVVLDDKSKKERSSNQLL